MATEGKTNDAPRVSVVMSLFNCLELTKACLESFLHHTPVAFDWELIFVDDGSTDGTRDWLCSLNHARFKVVLMERNGGYAKANNEAVRHARGRFLVLINNDLIFTPGWLEPLLKTLERDDAGIVGNVQFRVSNGALDHTGIEVNLHTKPEHVHDWYLLSPALRRTQAVTGACFALRTSLWRALGGFDERFHNGGEDVDLCFRVQEAGLPCHVALKSRLFHHVSPSPGRKARDEQNSHRLAVKWRTRLVRLAAKRWSREFLEKELNAAFAFAEPWEAVHLVACAWGFASSPPSRAVQAMEREMERQLFHWKQLGLATEIRD